MTKEDLEEEYQKEIREFIKKYAKIIDGMTEEEENNYIREHKVNNQLKEIQEKYRKKLCEVENGKK